jgi:hypothetical protein
VCDQTDGGQATSMCFVCVVRVCGVLCMCVCVCVSHVFVCMCACNMYVCCVCVCVCVCVICVCDFMSLKRFHWRANHTPEGKSPFGGHIVDLAKMLCR